MQKSDILSAAFVEQEAFGSTCSASTGSKDFVEFKIILIIYGQSVGGLLIRSSLSSNTNPSLNGCHDIPHMLSKCQIHG